MDHAPYCVNNAAARGEAAATSQKRVHELSSTSVFNLLRYQICGFFPILIHQEALTFASKCLSGMAFLFRLY